MLIGVQGKMGAGKTLTMSILCKSLAQTNHVPLFANYGLQGSERIKSIQDLWKLDNAVLAWDEIWLSLDARLWTDNVFVTRFINQTRKKKLILMYTTQHIRQVEMRVRNGTDILINAEKRREGHRITFIDWQYQTIGRQMIIPHADARQFWGIYDTYEVLEPLAKGGNTPSPAYSRPYPAKRSKKPYSSNNSKTREQEYEDNQLAGMSFEDA